MYEVTVERDFRAAHAIVVGGTREPVHDHRWRVTVSVAGAGLDGEGLLCDFHVLERRLDEALEGLRGRDLTETPPFDRINPTAENVARHIAGLVAADLPAGVSLSRVAVTEAPGCTATYRPQDTTIPIPGA